MKVQMIKISVDLKFDPRETSVTSNRVWKEQGYAKTSFVLVVDPHRAASEGNKMWTLVEVQANFNNNIEIGDINNKLASRGIDGVVKKMVAILHPKVDRPAGFRGNDDIAPTMYTAVDAEIDFEDEMCCFDCGEEQTMLLEPCDACGNNVCISCTKDIGGLCTCMLADNAEVVRRLRAKPNEKQKHDFQESAEKGREAGGRPGEAAG